MMVLPVAASQPCQHEECQADKSVLLQHAVKKHEHNASGHQTIQREVSLQSSEEYWKWYGREGFSKVGNHGCSNYASAELKQTWTTIDYDCGDQCAQTAGCIGYAWLGSSDTTCKGSSQSRGSCTLWKEKCIPDYSSGCHSWVQVQYRAPSWVQFGQIGWFGCKNYASSELKKTWTESENSCESECAQTAGCVGFAWLERSDTSCKGSSQSRGSCTLWKEACTQSFDPACKAWVQYSKGYSNVNRR